MTIPSARLLTIRQITSVLFVLIALGLASCSAKSIVSSWTDPAAGVQAGDTLMVGVAHRDTVRRLFEDSLVEGFSKENVKAVASYTVAGTEETPDYDAILTAVARTGSKTVLVARLANVSEQTTVQRALGREYMVFEQAEMAPIFMNPTPAYATNSTVKVQLEARLYDVVTKKMIWTATSKVTDPVMTKKYIDKVTGLFLADLKKNGLL